MSEQDDKPTGFRRVSRRDRKRKIESRGPLFPPESDESPEFAPPDLRGESKTVPPEKVTDSGDVILPEATVDRTPPSERFPPLGIESDNSDTLASDESKVVTRSRSTCLPNLIAIVFLIGSVVLIGVFALIFVNPYTPLNPFPPFTPIPILITATFLPPTATLEPSPGPTLTFTPLPAEAIVTRAPFAFIAANGAAAFVPNTNDQGCNWSSIAGSVTDLNNAPLDGYGIRVRGEDLDETIFTGAAQTFGPGGFELFLNGVPTEKTYTVQLLSPQSAPLSQEYTVTTRATCDENVAVISFLQIQAL